MDKIEKREFVASLNSDLSEANLVVITRQKGMTVVDTQALRKKMLEADAQFKVAKNTLVRIAVKDIDCEVLIPHLTGPTAIAYSKDFVAAAKVVCEYAKTNNKIEIVCGALGRKFLTSEAVQELAKLPSLNELRGKIVGIIQAPAVKIAGVVQAPAAQLARVFSAYATRD